MTTLCSEILTLGSGIWWAAASPAVRHEAGGGFVLLAILRLAILIQPGVVLGRTTRVAAGRAWDQAARTSGPGTRTVVKPFVYRHPGPGQACPPAPVIVGGILCSGGIN
jgi:hypothetical protein